MMRVGTAAALGLGRGVDFEASFSLMLKVVFYDWGCVDFGRLEDMGERKG
jgi:hypothetical protein